MTHVDLTEIDNWLQYCERPRDIPQVHVQFIILWIAFNSLYSDKYSSKDDKNKVRQFANDPDLIQLYKSLIEEDNKMASIFVDFKKSKPEGRSSVLNMRSSSSQAVTAKFDKRSGSAEDFLMAIYQIRCNLFHADKDPTNELDQKIVKWAYRYLKTLIDEYILFITAQVR